MALDPTDILDDSAALPPASPPKLPGARRQRDPLTVRARDLLSSYLPIMMMVLLAMATWWLAKQVPLGAAPVEQKIIQHEADYTMRQARVQRFNDRGVLQWQLEGDVIKHFPDTKTIQVEKVRVRAMAPDGSITEATAKRGEMPDDGSEVKLLGAATVQREATASREALQFDGEFLHLFVDARRIKSHLPVTFRLGQSVLRVASFEYDDQTQQAQLNGVRATVVMSPASRNTKATP
jgi:lipopolysaccharide export system protein LptC